MVSFYYYDQNPSGFCFLVQIKPGFCYLNLTGTTKFKYKKKNEMNSVLSFKKTSSCKWLIPCIHAESTREITPNPTHHSNTWSGWQKTVNVSEEFYQY